MMDFPLVQGTWPAMGKLKFTYDMTCVRLGRVAEFQKGPKTRLARIESCRVDLGGSNLWPIWLKRSFVLARCCLSLAVLSSCHHSSLFEGSAYLPTLPCLACLPNLPTTLPSRASLDSLLDPCGGLLPCSACYLNHTDSVGSRVDRSRQILHRRWSLRPLVACLLVPRLPPSEAQGRSRWPR